MTELKEYDQFIRSKTHRANVAGFEPRETNPRLFDWQKYIVSWAVKTGRAALFEDCGLGKTVQQLEFADQVCRETGGSVLLLAPLAVSQQTHEEAASFGYNTKVVSDSESMEGDGIFITNYEKLHHFEDVDFAGVVLDESSILKNFTGKTRRMLTERFSETPYRLCCTATPSPNDYTEFGQHADFLGVCSPMQMLSTFFINDTFNTGDWRLKKHAENQFWEWVASWAACVSKPSDIGFQDQGYDLPPLNMSEVVVEVDETEDAGDGELFRSTTVSATTIHKEMRRTAPDRVAKVAQMVNSSDEPWIVWCNTNDESALLKSSIPDAVEVKGSDTPTVKEKRLSDFSHGEARVIITKPSIAGYGLNWQHCRNVAFVGLSYSFEDFYQALRRSYRFGQEKEVNAYIVRATTEEAVLKVVKRKIEQHAKMQEQMKIAAAVLKKSDVKQLDMKTEIDTANGDGWTMHNGDCVRVAKTIKDHSIHHCVFSPPFADLFTYSDDLQDMGNCKDNDEFFAHFKILIAELRRVMMPGREVAVHCVDLLSSKWKHGSIQFQDFSGEIIRAFWAEGFRFHSRITIWKSPVTEMQRTKAHGLLYKTLKSDSSSSRVGAPDYLLVFRAPGDNPVPVTKNPDQYPVDLWQEIASPVWMTIDQGNVLNRDGARDHQDEKHICPLQLDVIERSVNLWSNPGELVYSPFAGIGSEGYQSLKLGRQFVGSELKESYFKQACQNLENAKLQPELFEGLA